MSRPTRLLDALRLVGRRPVQSHTSTSTDLKRPWTDRQWNRKGPAGEDLLRRGVCQADLDACARVQEDAGAVLLGGGSAYVLRQRMNTLAWAFQETMTVRAAVGWCLYTTGHPPPTHLGAVDVVQPWVDAGLGESGWLFASAGLTIAEAREVTASADPHAWDAVWMLAGLSGAPLPAYPDAPCPLEPPSPASGASRRMWGRR